MIEEFRLRDQVKIYSPVKFTHHVQMLNERMLQDTGLVINTDRDLGIKTLALSGLS